MKAESKIPADMLDYQKPPPLTPWCRSSMARWRLPSQAHLTYNLKTGEMMIMPANEPHALKAVSPYKMLLTMIRS